SARAASTELYALSLHDALPICARCACCARARRHRAAAAVQRRSDRLLDRGLLAGHGGHRPDGSEGRGAAPSPRPRCGRTAAPLGRCGGAAPSREEEEVAMSPRLPERLRAIAGELPEPGRLPEDAFGPFETIRPSREGHVERDGVRCWYAVWGDSGPWIAFAPPFQMVHSQLLKATVPYLAGHFRVVTTD